MMLAKPMESDPPARPKERKRQRGRKALRGMKKKGLVKNPMFSILFHKLLFLYVSNRY
jgi:hypothetical protein